MARRLTNRWIAVGIFFLFMLLHQTDRLLIGPLTSAIMADFNLSEVQMGGIITGSLILGSLFYPIWGFLYDRFARPKLLAIASLIWGFTTWFSAIAPTPSYSSFHVPQPELTIQAIRESAA